MGSVSVFSAAARRLEGKVAIITGGARGIGECTARLFAKHGAKLVIADIQDDLGHRLAKELDTASFIHCDVTNENDIKDTVDFTTSKHGKLDIMFNNAGIAGPLSPNIVDLEKAQFEEVININLIGPFLGLKHAARAMIRAQNRGGSIINTASVCSIIGGTCPHGYTTAKHAVVGLTRNTAVELGRYGIRVNCISPYVVRTRLSEWAFDLNDDKGFEKIYSNLKGSRCTAEDVAEAAVYLGSDESKYVSGHNLVVDGGFSITNAGFSMYE